MNWQIENFPERFEVFDEMERSGGGFIQCLAAAWRRADEDNFSRLMSVFGNVYWHRYAEAAKQRKSPVSAAAEKS